MRGWERGVGGLAAAGLVAGLVAAVLVAGCSGPAEPDDPLASLSWPELSTSYTAEYWSGEAKADTAVWRQATAFCAEPARQLLPNCETVRQLHFILTLKDSAGRRSPAYDGKGGVEMPPAVQEQLDRPASGAPPAPGGGNGRVWDD